MLAHSQRNDVISSIHSSKHSKLIAALRTAVENGEGILVKTTC